VRVCVRVCVRGCKYVGYGVKASEGVAHTGPTVNCFSFLEAAQIGGGGGDMQ
jgi:hypothetical protein